MKYANFSLRLITIIAVLCPLAGLFTVKTSALQDTAKTRQLHLIITDNKSSESLDKVAAADISVVENGVQQTVQSLEMLELPVYYGLVIDTSGSMRSQFPTILDTARTLLSGNQSEDRTFILSFIDTISMVQEPTSDKAQLLNATSELKINQGQTALFDAIYTGLTELQKVRDTNARKALVLITDGENRASRIKENELFKALREADVKIFIIGMVEALDREGGVVRKSRYDSSVDFLERLAKETGGRAFFSRPADNRRAVTRIVHDLRRQYLLRYVSPNAPQKPTYKLEIKVSEGADKKKRKAIFRPTYTAQQLASVDK